MSADASSETNDTNNNSNKFDAGSNNSIVGKILVMSNDLLKQQTDKELNNNNSKQVSPPQTPSTATTDKMAPPVTVVESTTQQQVATEDASSPSPPPPHTVIQCDTQQQVCSRLLSDTNEEDKDEDADKAPRNAPQEQNNQPAPQTNHTIDSASSKPNNKKLHSTTVAINQSNPSAAESQEKAKKGVTSLPLNTIAANGQSNPLESTQSPTKANRLQEGQSPNDYNQSGNNNNNNNTNNYNHLNKNSNNHSYIGTTTTTPATTPTTTPTITEATTKRQHRLSFFQSLILRKWPYLALAILTMSSLMFAIILSAFTIYLMHGSVDCGSLALAAAGSSASASSIPAGSVSASSGGSHHHFHMPHELVLGSHHHRPPPPTDFESPIELASGIGGSVAASPENLSGRLSLTSSIGASDTSSSSSLQARQQQPVAATAFERLPRSIWPQHYDLFIWPYIAEPFNFSGKVSIHLKCREPTDNITLHTLDLKLDEQSIRLDGSPTSNAGGAIPKVTGLSQDKQLQHSIIKLDSQLKRDQIYVLSMDFTGTLNDDLNGFYKIKYERQNSTELSWIAATQFQATDARRAFPCFDEPIYKATFGIKIKHWKNMTALSNMPIINREDSPDGLWVTDTFAKSHQMSTYLVAYAVTNFESRSEGNISVWTRPGLTHTAEYALKIAGKILRYYEEFFGIEYPLPKMDMIALPDFNAGAMENWGLITYRESSMLYDETSSSVANKERVAIVVAHELAHQWFGNLVTPKWWDDLWLNEGFASFVEYIGVDHVEPGWKMLDQFVTEEVQGVFRLDSLSSSHQISIPVNNPDEISEIFDHISYSKGASIIRMMLHFLTKDVFKLGLQRYLRALKYSNAEQSDLWAYLTEAQHVISKQSGNITSNNGYNMNNQPEINVERVMNTWTLQTGFPIVTLTRSYDGSRTATLEQLRYQLYKTPLPTAASMEGGQPKNNTNPSRPLSGAQKWEIPITYTWKSEQNWEPRTRAWMHQNDSSALRLHAEQLPESDNEWILLNLDHVGYYRVNYDRRNWQLLIDQLNEDHTKIKTTNRAQLLDDIFELAKSGDVEYKFALEATRYLKKEQDFLPWDTALGAFSYIDEMLKRTPLYGEWEDYVRDLTAPYYGRYKHLEWTMDGSGDGGANATTMFGTNDILEENNQVLAVAWACQVDKHCINKAKRVFNVWKQTGVNRINPALRYATYCTAIENGDRSDWDFLWKNYEKEQSASERDRILRSLGCSKEVWILSRYLEWIFDKTKPIRRQDGSFVFRVIANNNNGRDIAFNFMRERWQQIKEHYGKTSFSMGHLIRSISTSMNTQTELNQLVAFYDTVKNDVGNGKRSFQIAIEEVDGNIMWKNRNYKILEDWIQSELKKSAKIN